MAGGSANYAALTAAYLGCEARVVTRHGADFVGLPALAAAGVTVGGGGGPCTTTFGHVYRDGVRESRLLAVAGPLDEPAAADIVLCCPVAGEVGPRALRGEPGALVGAGLQGWLRRFDADGAMRRAPLGDVGFLAGCRAVFLSSEDDDDAPALVDRLRAVVPIVVMTRGASGAELHEDGVMTRVAAAPAREVDPTGAGDVFAAAFLVALARGEGAPAAAAAAARAAAIVVEDVGPAALPRLRVLR